MILSCDDVPAQLLPPAGAVVGVDVGIASFLTTSAGEHEPNPTFLERSAGRLAAAQRDLSRTKRGSARHRKAAARVGTISRRVARQRLDHAHKTAFGLVRDHDLIAVEKLNVKGMVRRARARPDPDTPGGVPAERAGGEVRVEQVDPGCGVGGGGCSSGCCVPRLKAPDGSSSRSTPATPPSVARPAAASPRRTGPRGPSSAVCGAGIPRTRTRTRLSTSFAVRLTLRRPENLTASTVSGVTRRDAPRRVVRPSRRPGRRRRSAADRDPPAGRTDRPPRAPRPAPSVRSPGSRSRGSPHLPAHRRGRGGRQGHDRRMPEVLDDLPELGVVGPEVVPQDAMPSRRWAYPLTTGPHPQPDHEGDNLHRPVPTSPTPTGKACRPRNRCSRERICRSGRIARHARRRKVFD